MIVYVTLLIAILLAAFTQGVAGFGSGLVAMAILPLVMPLDDAVPIVAMTCLVVNFSILVQMWRHVERAKVLPMVLGALVGVPLGAVALKQVDPGMLELVLGVILIAYAAHALFGGSGRRVVIGDRWGLVTGVVGGVLGGAFNTGGPPAVVYVTMRDWSKDATKATLQGFFCAISTLQMPIYVAADVLGTEHLKMAAVALPTLGIGLWLGTKVYDRIDAPLFRRIVLVMIAVMGVVFVVRELLPASA